MSELLILNHIHMYIVNYKTRYFKKVFMLTRDENSICTPTIVSFFVSCKRKKKKKEREMKFQLCWYGPASTSFCFLNSIDYVAYRVLKSFKLCIK